MSYKFQDQGRLLLYTDNRGIRWFLAVDFRLNKACGIEQLFELLRGVGSHAFHHIGPLGIAIYHLYQDGELPARLQHTVHLL